MSANKKISHRDEVLADMDEQGQRFYSTLWMFRGVDWPCVTCIGTGVRAYANTSMWRGGIGGQAITSGPCDDCWGSGDAYRKGADLRRMEGEMRTLTARCAELEGQRDEYRQALLRVLATTDEYGALGEPQNYESARSAIAFARTALAKMTPC